MTGTAETVKVTLIGSQDGDLEALLRSSGLTPTCLPMQGLADLTQHTARQPDVVLLDLRPLGSVPPSLAALTRQHPSTRVIIVAKAMDPNLILSAMRAGANECVAEPLTKGELDAALTRVVMMRQPAQAPSQSFAIIGAKGGVGATALAVNVATALARVATTNALLIDLHVSRGDAATYLDVQPRFSVMDALDNIQRLDEAFFKTLVTPAPSKLGLLAAPDTSSLTRLEAGRVKTLLEFTGKLFQFTIVDVPRTEPGALDALDAMNAIVIVTTQEAPAVRSAAAMANRLRQRYPKDRVRVVMNRLDKQSDISHELVETVLGMPVAHGFPSDYRLALQSLNKGLPLVLDNHSGLAASFERFARDLAGLQIDSRNGKNGAGGGSWSRISGRK